MDRSFRIGAKVVVKAVRPGSALVLGTVGTIRHLDLGAGEALVHVLGGAAWVPLSTLKVIPRTLQEVPAVTYCEKCPAETTDPSGWTVDETAGVWVCPAHR